MIQGKYSEHVSLMLNMLATSHGLGGEGSRKNSQINHLSGKTDCLEAHQMEEILLAEFAFQ